MKDFLSDDEMKALEKKHSSDFISDEEMSKLEASSKPGALETFSKNALDVATLDHAPQVIAGIKTIGGTTDDYVAERDKQRKIIEEGNKENPTARYAGAAAGVVAPIAATAVMPEVTLPAALQKVAEAYPLLSKIAKGFAAGETISALKNPGDIEGKVSGPQLQERAENALSDAPLNAGLSVVGATVSNKLAKLAGNKDMETLKALGPLESDIKDANTRNRTKDLADFIKRNGIIDGFPDEKEVAQRAAAVKDKAGKVIGDLFKRNTPELEKKLPNALDSFDPDQLLKKLSEDREGEGEAAQAVVGKVLSIIDDVKANKGTENLNLDDLHRIKQRVQDQIRNWKTALAVDKNAGPMVDMYQDASKYFDDMMTDKLNLLDGRLGSELRIANRNFNLASNVNQIAEKNYHSSEAASKGSNLISDLVKNIASPMRGQMPPAITTPNLNAKMANSEAFQNVAQPLTNYGAQMGYNVLRGPRELTVTQRAKIVDQERKAAKAQLGR